jgi:hypothetical protein
MFAICSSATSGKSVRATSQLLRRASGNVFRYSIALLRVVMTIDFSMSTYSKPAFWQTRSRMNSAGISLMRKSTIALMWLRARATGRSITNETPVLAAMSSRIDDTLFPR